MNIYIRYFNQDFLAHTIDELIDFLSSIPDIKINDELIADIRKYMDSDMPYPKRYKIRPRVYFILIKTSAETLDEFRENRNNPEILPTNEAQIKKDSRISALNETNEGWYKGTICFKRVVQNPETGKFQYKDTTFSALVRANSGQECYDSIIEHLKNRKEIDPRSQFPSARGNNFNFLFIGEHENSSREQYQQQDDLQ